MVEVIDSYTGGSNSSTDLSGPYPTVQYSAAYQSFKTPNKWLKVTSAKFITYKSTGVSGTIQFAIFAHIGVLGEATSKPYGEPLALSEAVDANAQPFGDQQIELDFIGDQQIRLTPNTEYCVAIIINGTHTNYYHTKSHYAIGGVTHQGTMGIWDGTKWVANQVDRFDRWFYVYGEETEPPPPAVNPRLLNNKSHVTVVNNASGNLQTSQQSEMDSWASEQASRLS